MALPIIQQIEDNADSVADLLNKAEQVSSARNLLHRAGSIRGGRGAGGVTWADKRELLADPLEGHDQVVGHTVTYDIESHEFSDRRIVFTDVLDYRIRFYELEC